jgi:hypothetical protein
MEENESYGQLLGNGGGDFAFNIERQEKRGTNFERQEKRGKRTTSLKQFAWKIELISPMTQRVESGVRFTTYLRASSADRRLDPIQNLFPYMH